MVVFFRKKDIQSSIFPYMDSNFPFTAGKSLLIILTITTGKAKSKMYLKIGAKNSAKLPVISDSQIQNPKNDEKRGRFILK